MPQPFARLLQEAQGAAIVRIEEIRLLPQPYEGIELVPELTARVRIAEQLFGAPSRVANLVFSGSACGGHDLHVGEHYLLLLADDTTTVTLAAGSEAIVYLFGEYREWQPSRESPSVLLMYLRNHVRGGRLPEAFPIEGYLDHTRAHVPPMPPR